MGKKSGTTCSVRTDAEAAEFSRTYHIPLGITVTPARGEAHVGSVDDKTREVTIGVELFRCGLRLPLHPWVEQVLFECGIPLAPLVPNAMYALYSYCSMIAEREDPVLRDIDVDIFRSMYTPKEYGEGPQAKWGFRYRWDGNPFVGSSSYRDWYVDAVVLHPSKGRFPFLTSKGETLPFMLLKREDVMSLIGTDLERHRRSRRPLLTDTTMEKAYSIGYRRDDGTLLHRQEDLTWRSIARRREIPTGKPAIAKMGRGVASHEATAKVVTAPDPAVKEPAAKVKVTEKSATPSAEAQAVKRRRLVKVGAPVCASPGTEPQGATAPITGATQTWDKLMQEWHRLVSGSKLVVGTSDRLRYNPAPDEPSSDEEENFASYLKEFAGGRHDVPSLGMPSVGGGDPITRLTGALRGIFGLLAEVGEDKRTLRREALIREQTLKDLGAQRDQACGDAERVQSLQAERDQLAEDLEAARSEASLLRAANLAHEAEKLKLAKDLEESTAMVSSLDSENQRLSWALESQERRLSLILSLASGPPTP